MVERPGSLFVMGSVPTGEFTLDYAVAGPVDAEATLVSFPGSAGLEMSTAKDALACVYRVVEINPPGWGGKDDLSREVDMQELGRLLVDAANKLVPGSYHILGTSMGGVNAIHAAALHPDRVRGLILEGSMAPARPEDLWAPPPAIVDATAVGEPAYSTADADASTAAAYPLPPFNPKKPWATEDFVREQMMNRLKMFRWVKLEMLPEAALASIQKADIPVMALLGEADEILKPTQQETFSKYLPDGVFELVPGGGHDLQNTAPEEFVRLVKDFVRA
jgi:pimeloyl-ACP methyl ester carboxylesterase